MAKDIDIWEVKKNHRDVYDKTKILDWQNIPWKLKSDDSFFWGIPHIISNDNIEYLTTEYQKGLVKPGIIFLDHELSKSEIVYSQVAMSKGEILKSQHFDHDKNPIEKDVGSIDIKVYSFAMLFLKKYTGFVSLYSLHNNIYAVSLQADNSLTSSYSTSMKSVYTSLYKKSIV